MAQYKPRIIDELLRFKLKSKGAVLIEGAKWCGKTTTAEQAAKSILYFGDPVQKEQNIKLAEIEPIKLLEGDTPRLIDEWQLAPKLWDAVRFEVDQRRNVGQFILTGSSVPADKTEITHSGTGRFAWLKMRPMSLFESGESNGSISLKDLFTGKKDTAINDFYKLDDLAFATCRGGWPMATLQKGEIALSQAYDYIDATIHDDVSRVDNINRNSLRMEKLLRSYARLQGSQASYETIVNDISSNDDIQIDRDTASSYIEALKKIFVIEDSIAWNPNIRSKVAIRTGNTRYFVDPSIATASLKINPDGLINDLKLFGFIFETMCIRDLRVYAESLGASVYHYRDSRGLECDAVIVMPDESFGLVEIKLGGDDTIAEGIANLNKLSEDLAKKPTFKMVLTGTSRYTYYENDVMIVPLGCLKN